MAKIKAAIFDLDGTLLDTLSDLHHTMSAVLFSAGYPALTIGEVKHLIGNGAREFMRLSMPPHARTEENIDKHLAIYHELYKLLGEVETKPYPGIGELLAKLNGAEIPVAVLSNKPHAATLTVIERYFPHIKFAGVLGQKQEFLPKPDTASALHMAERLGLKPDEIAFVGDGDADAMTAVSGGFYQIAVLWGYRTREELSLAGAVRFAGDVAALEKMLL